MYFRVKHFDKYVGVFVLVSVVVMIAAVVFVGRGQRWFERRHTFITIVEDAGGVETGAKVILSGIEIGTVKGIRLNETNEVEITLSILDTYRDRIRVDSVARISGPIIGSKVIEVSAGSIATPLIDEGGVIRSQKTREFKDIIEEINLKSPVEKITQTLENIRSITENFNRESDATAISIREASERINSALDKITGDIGYITEGLKGSLERMTGNLEDTTEEVGKASKSLAKTFRNIESMTDRMEVGQGNIGAVIKERDIYDNVMESTASMKRTLANLEQASSDIPGMMEKISEAIDDIKRSTGSIPHIVNTGQETVEDAQKVLRSLKKTWPISRNIKEPEPADALHIDSREGPYKP